ncbi:hypothetical protein [Candidatus Thiosymbion oneisti]|uniref:hypothetical protein n=1 Tax=Candidatus Thiosymbion oneisti TaxID=589554 RepID=UPI00105B4679|nr:hypothetical protein [Candidatus Thiosymbion oneisti]
MLSTVEVIVEKNGNVRLLEPLHPSHAMRALLTLLEPLEKSTITPKRSLHEFIGILKNSTLFSGNPVTLQRDMRDEWD